jgi:glycosyltransferase involved in cell wall biosynthesis
MGADSPLVTVVVPSYNAEKYLRNAVDSALGQTYDRLEVIVVDDGSAMPQAEVLSEVRDVRLRTVRQENAGVAAARNRGARLGQGGLIAFLDADDRWFPEKLEAQVPLFDAGVAVVFSDQYRFRNETRFDATYFQHLPVPEPKNFLGGLIRRNFVALSTAVVSRTAFERVGGFSEARGIWEDWDLWLRLAETHVFRHVPRPLCEYRVHETNASGDVEVMVRRSLGTLERLLEEEPTLLADHGDDVRASRAILYFDLGYAKWQQGKAAEARRALCTALRYRPFDPPTIKTLLRVLTHL